MTQSPWVLRVAASSLVCVSLSSAVAVAQVAPPPLTQLQFDIVGMRLVVDPPALTVPKNIATQINTSLVVPGTSGNAAQEALAQLTQGAVVEAQLRGPEIPPTTLRVQPGHPIPLPAFALPGDYVLDGIRLVKNGVPLLDAQAPDGRPATTIPIRVIGDILVSSVTTRPLSLDEIRSKGIVIDETNFKTVNFQVAFNIDGQPFTIDLPAALPTPDLLRTPAERERVKIELSAINRQLATTLTKLPPQLDRPGLNFSIAALPFFPVLQEDEEPSFDIPPITGLIVIPGNVAFLNQFFSVMLMVTNVAPDGTPLVVRSVTGTITLPTGLDRVAGTQAAPGDDPLRLARIEGIGAQQTIPVMQAGTDGEFGTADDLDALAPQTMGQGEFLVEGLKEGGHGFDIRISGTLEGLPSGPVEVEGLAAGAVFVRNPSFSVSLAHPRIIRAGEPYDLYATVTNTSASVGNLVSVGLDPYAISGAELLSSPQVQFETIAAGQSAVARFRLRAQVTGEVTFSSFTGDVPGDIRLTTGVGERGVPLAPNAIVLPRTTDLLPASLVAAAQRVLGQAFSIATAPADALPPGVLFVRKQTVISRGQELAEAGQRVQFGGNAELERAMRDLTLDWIGARTPDAGFDQLLRTTEAGRAFLAELGLLLGPSFTADVLGAQHQFAQATVARGPQLSAAGGPSGGAGPGLSLRITRAGGATADASANGIASSALFPFGDPAATSFFVATPPEITTYTVEGTAAGLATYDVGLVVPTATAGTLVHLRFDDVELAAGGVVTIDVDLAATGPYRLQIDRDGDGTPDSTRDATITTVVEGPPQVVDVVQLESSFYDGRNNFADPATYGLLVGVLFDKPVTEASAEAKTNYTIDANRIIGAQLQPSGRLAYLYLERPIGGLVPRSLTIAGVVDERGTPLATTTRPIRSDRTDGVRVFGQVREGTGVPVPEAVITLVRPGHPSFTIAVIQADAEGRFEFDFVPTLIETFALSAQHPRTGERVTLTARIRGAGDRMLVNPTFVGKGTVRGRILSSDGVTPVPGAEVALIPGAVMSTSGLQALTNALGEYVFSQVDVGNFTIVSRDATGLSGRAVGVIPAPGAEVTFDVVLVDRPDDGGRVVGRVFLSDGVTPASGFAVYVGSYSRSSASIEAIDQATTDATGSFAFPSFIPARQWSVVAADAASGQIGVVLTNVVARTTTSVSIVMEATGTVEGVVFTASGQPVAGAVVAGGLALVTTDANGFFRVTDVPAGRRAMEAGDPITRKRGAATVDVVPGQTVTAAITLEARATIRGRVLDVNGVPVPFASVRIPQMGGYTFVIANSQGVYTLPDLPLGDYLIQSPGPSKESLVDYMSSNGIDPDSAFTSGDGPGAPPSVNSGDVNAVIAAYQQAVQNFFSIDESLVSPPAMAAVGGFGYTKASLFQDGVTVVRDIRFLPQGHVAGTTRDSNGLPTGALVRIRGLKVGLTGLPLFFELERKNSDAQSGAFRFDNVPRFDQETFQTAGVRGGDFEVQAASPFSPVIPSVFGQLNTATPDIDTLVVQFPAAAETNGTISGLVLLPDGVTPAPAGTTIRISFGDLTVTTRPDGTFESVLPIPAGTYALTAQTAVGGLHGQVSVVVPAGGSVSAQIRLLGLGGVVVQAQKVGGAPVGGAAVELRRGTFPFERLEGTTDPQGRVRFVNVSEGPFSIVAIEAVTGLTGRTNGAAARDTDVAVVATITPSGRVTGTFLTADGQRPVPFAQVTLGSSIQAFATTDVDGRFELSAIPVGSFTIEAVDPATARRGRATGQVTAEGQSVDITVLQLPRGTVTGFVVNADGVTRVGGASVSIESGSFVRTSLLATSRPDGRFSFEGIPAGTFTLRADDPVTGAKGSVGGTLTSEGESIEQNVTLEPFGSVLVTVRDRAGALATNASVSMSGSDPRGRTGTTDVNGQVPFDNLTMGTYRIVARSLSESRDAGAGEARLTSAGQRAEVTVELRGVGPLTVSVVSAVGQPVASAGVVVHSTGGFNGQTGPGADTINGFTNAAGVVSFPSVATGDVTVQATAGALAGTAAGTIPTSGQAPPITVALNPSGSVTGRVLLPGGAIPAVQALVTLRFASQSSQVGALQATTGLAGTFAFTGIPLGPVTLSVFEVVTQGVRTRTGTLSGASLDLGDVVLDNEAPRVSAIAPADGAANVAPGAPIAITFNEPMAASSLTADNVRLLLGTTAVAATRTLSADGLTLTIQPAAPLVGGARYTVAVQGAPNGPKDASAISLIDPFVAAFTVRDTVAPLITSTSPAADAVQVLPEATVRVAFSESVATATLVVRDDLGAVVPGATALALGNTVAVFSPLDFLRANSRYTFTVSNVADLAGNPLPGGTFAASFATVDTIAPLIAALQVTGAPRAGATITIVPQIAAGDTARVEYTPAFGQPVVSRTSPFSLALVLPTGVAATSVSAVAIDAVGNRSAAFVHPIAIAANAPPQVQIVTVGNLANVAGGQVVDADITATDDDAVAQVVFSASGVATFTETRSVAGTPASTTQRFRLTVPANAPVAGQLVLSAAAIDTAGNASATSVLTLPMRDGQPPSVTVVSPPVNSAVTPGAVVPVVVDVVDAVGIVSVTLTCTPAASGCETRAIGGAASTQQTFQVLVPANLVAPATFVLVAQATDLSGNVGSGGRTLAIADTVPPTVTSVVTTTGSLRVLAGESIGITAGVADNAGLQSVRFTATSGAFTATQTVAVAGLAAQATFTLDVPATLAAGAEVLVTAVARDAAGIDSQPSSTTLSVGDASPPTVSLIEPANGATVSSGGTLVVRATANDDVLVSRVVFRVRGAFVFDDSVSFVPGSATAEAQASVPVPASAVGAITVAVQAIDSAGNPSAAAERAVTVVDRTAPSVVVTSPANNASFDPRTAIPVGVSATDNIGVTEIALTRIDAQGVATLVETRPVVPPAATRNETFSVTLPAPAPTATTLRLRASARDAAGNLQASADVTVSLLDVVPPTVTSSTPLDGATGVDVNGTISVAFSEPMDAATLTTAGIALRTGATGVPVSVSVGGGGLAVIVTPAVLPLQVNTQYTLTLTGLRDAAGNPLPTQAITFRTATPDAVAPTVTSIDPAAGALGVPALAPVAVTFSEAVDPATVTSASFRVSVDGVPVPGALTFASAGTIARFTPSVPYGFEKTVVVELTGAIRDVVGNALVNADGSAVTTPITSTFLTGNFALTSPATATVLEATTITLEAQASASLAPASVVFSVNGVALPADTVAPFSSTFNVPPAASTPSLLIVASARNASNAEIARAEKTVTVVAGIRLSPTLLGVPRGGSRPLTLSVAEPAADDIVVAMTSADTAVATVAPAQATIAAGTTSVAVTVTGCVSCPFEDEARLDEALGNTTVIATSSRGTASAVVSVSDPVPARDITALAQVGVAVSNAPSLGHVVLPAGRTFASLLQILGLPAQALTSVSVFSSNPGVATGTATAIPAGGQATTLTIEAIADGVATLTLRAGDEVRAITIIVGALPPGFTPLAMASPVGAAVVAAPLSGQLIVPLGRAATSVVSVLSSPLAGAVSAPVRVTSSDPLVATATATAVAPGTTTTTLSVTGLATGATTLTLFVGCEPTGPCTPIEVRAVIVQVGTPAPDRTVPVLALPIGVAVTGLPFIGKAFVPTGQGATLGVLFLPSARPSATSVAITSSDPAVVTVTSPVEVAAGELTVPLQLTTGVAGRATLTLRAGDIVREFEIVVGTPPTSDNSPVIAALPVGATVVPLPGMGRLAVRPGAPVSTTLGVPLPTTASGSDRSVVVTTSNPAIVSMGGGGSSATLVLSAGSTVLNLGIATSGATGAAVVTITIDGVTRELLILVGDVPPGEQPALTAPVIGVRVP